MNWTDAILETSDRLGTKNIIIPKVPVGAVKSKLRKTKKNLAEHDIYINEHYTKLRYAYMAICFKRVF